MATNRKVRILVMTAALLCAPGLAAAQTTTTAPPHVPLQKTNGQTGSDIVPSLIVINSRGATLQGQKLVLSGVSPNSIVFADRPVRAAGHALTKDLLDEWAPDSGTFASDPPNATVSAFSKDGSSIRDAVVVLKAPSVQGDKLTFDVTVLEGELTGADGSASIFIDRFGYGFGGVGRPGVGVGCPGVGVGRPGYGVARAGWYRGAAVGAAVGAAAVGAAAYGAYGAPACGYYLYPPCY